jgi:hypothetical protein
MNKTKYRGFVIIVGIILLSFGVYIGFKMTDENITNNEVIVDKDTDNISKDEEKPVISNNIISIEVVHKEYYKKCGETITISDFVYDKNIETIKKDNSNYTVEEESESKIVFSKVNDGYCNNHFELKIVDNYVVIYKIVDDGVSIIYKRTDICADRIREEIKLELEKGIKINSMEELNTIIEDIES